MKNSLIVLGAAALLSTAAVANDASTGESKGDTFAMLDADSDGKLSKEEVAGNTSITTSFDRLDGNSDGFITKREFRRNTRPKSRD
jgi:Ca2+-binding EF-hand superfamily protein